MLRHVKVRQQSAACAKKLAGSPANELASPYVSAQSRKMLSVEHAPDLTRLLDKLFVFCGISNLFRDRVTCDQSECTMPAVCAVRLTRSFSIDRRALAKRIVLALMRFLLAPVLVGPFHRSVRMPITCRKFFSPHL